MTNTWKATYAQLGTSDEHETETLDEALHYLWHGEMEGKLASHEVVAPDGSVYLDRRQVMEIIYREFGDYGEWNEATSPTIAEINRERS